MGRGFAKVIRAEVDDTSTVICLGSECITVK